MEPLGFTISPPGKPETGTFTDVNRAPKLEPGTATVGITPPHLQVLGEEGVARYGYLLYIN